MKRISVVMLALFGFVALPPAARAAETLMAAPYPANAPWKNITDKANGEQKLLEWIPADQNENAINDILTEQVFYKLKSADPAMFIGNIITGSTQACDRIRVNGPTRQTENGYPVAYAQIYCGHQKGTTIDVDIFIKAIGGHDAMYVVQREFHRPAASGGVPGVISFAKNQDAQMKAFTAAYAAANDYLVSKVHLCASASCAAQPRNGGGTSIQGLATADQVKAKLGKPSFEDHNPDGRFIYMYDQLNNQVAAYLFDAKGALIRVRTYQRTGQ
jgi:hypothetical protein